MASAPPARGCIGAAGNSRGLAPISGEEANRFEGGVVNMFFMHKKYD
jgi:hypothetical protein